MQTLLLCLLLWIVLGSVVVGWTSRAVLIAFWREPMLKRPVLIIESDDWGAGPAEQAEQLARIAALLGSYRDDDGRRPVMTLGLVLSIADGARVTAEGFRHYYRKSLDDAEFGPILAAIKRGVDDGVFALQLHGGEHYWPQALISAARSDPHIASWLSGPGIPRTEALPAALQSRWIDTTELPSKPLPVAEVKAAALAEAASFRDIFGGHPAVAVPPTFIWNDAVEASWAEAGVQFVVTPGRRYGERSADGEPGAAGPSISNGDGGVTGITYLVRDEYFEPARGHKAERALDALTEKTRAGRPTLLETHRANFLGDAAAADAALGEVDRLLTMTLHAYPRTMFVSTAELGMRLRRADPHLVERRFGARLHIWLRRLWNVARLRKLSWLTGAIAPAWLVYVLSDRAAAAPRPSGK